jgi:hypothetical protein
MSCLEAADFSVGLVDLVDGMFCSLPLNKSDN